MAINQMATKKSKRVVTLQVLEKRPSNLEAKKVLDMKSGDVQI